MIKGIIYMLPVYIPSVISVFLIWTDKKPYVGIGYTLLILTILIAIMFFLTQLRNVPRVLKGDWGEEKRLAGVKLRRLYRSFNYHEKIRFTFFKSFRNRFEVYKKFKSL
jgi:ABC-type xylose transport system permease subunit